jgi:DNA-binding PadR family transcriptional regulator
VLRVDISVRYVGEVIELAVLGLLREQELHGYELRKRLGQLLGSRLAVSFGSLYPALARLEADGSVKAVEAFTESRPAASVSTGSLAGEASAFFARRRATRPKPAGRGKKVYGITDRGGQHLADLLDDPALDDKSFSLKVAFCSVLTPERRLELFERRRAALARQLADARARRRSGGERLDRYLGALREHDTETTQHDIDWLDRLIADERTALADRPAPPARKETPR